MKKRYLLLFFIFAVQFSFAQNGEIKGTTITNIPGITRSLSEVIAREKAIIVELMKQDPKMAGKPDEMMTKIADGKMGAFFKEQTLTAQTFVKDSSKTVADYLKESGDVKVTEFKRVALG